MLGELLSVFTFRFDVCAVKVQNTGMVLLVDEMIVGLLYCKRFIGNTSLQYFIHVYSTTKRQKNVVWRVLFL